MVMLFLTICVNLTCTTIPAPYYEPTLPTQCAIDGLYSKLQYEKQNPETKIVAWKCVKTK